jgi:hypothetical protein
VPYITDHPCVNVAIRMNHEIANGTVKKVHAQPRFWWNLKGATNEVPYDVGMG